ncbi:hypothetical protein TcWFU_000543 [Taenia crassiceps]|uniref:Uncharacterized protein n=1 Tax=Taenia crassiceps TaxID=6207 RepID=A0ABR4QP73_9CEST
MHKGDDACRKKEGESNAFTQPAKRVFSNRAATVIDGAVEKTIVLANEYAGYEQYYQAYGTQQMPEHTDVAEPVMEAAAPTTAMQLLAQTGLELDTMSKSDMEAATTESSSATSFTAQEISEKTTSKTSAISSMLHSYCSPLSFHPCTSARFTDSQPASTIPLPPSFPPFNQSIT